MAVGKVLTKCYCLYMYDGMVKTSMSLSKCIYIGTMTFGQDI